ncbi:MAG: glycosyltransferase family 2 protein [Thermomicrobiales bacterium]|nr:glycosyltransferase family 2 protein [Thermomicrobiales bacterium]
MTMHGQSTPEITVVIPVYNEAHRIGRTLEAVVSFFVSRDAEILIVDDGSTDDTIALAEEIASNTPMVRVLAEKHRGKAATVLSGLESARGNIVGFMDADLATPLDTWDRCEEALRNGAGVAIASREGVGSNRLNEPAYRHVMGRIFNGLVRLLLLPGIDDTQCGFKVFTRATLDDVLPRMLLYRDAREVRTARVTAFDVELLYLARKYDHEIAIIPITWEYGEQSKVNPLTDTIQNVLDVLKVKINDIRGRY